MRCENKIYEEGGRVKEGEEGEIGRGEEITGWLRMSFCMTWDQVRASCGSSCHLWASSSKNCLTLRLSPVQ